MPDTGQLTVTALNIYPLKVWRQSTARYVSCGELADSSILAGMSRRGCTDGKGAPHRLLL